MSLSQQERDRVAELKKQGFTTTEITGYIASERAGTPSLLSKRLEVQNNTQTAVQDPNSAVSDLSRGFQGAQTAFQEGLDRTEAAGQRETLLGRTAGRIGAGFRFAGEALGSIGEGALRALPGGTTAVDTIEAGVGAGARAIGGSRAGQAIGGAAKGAFEALPQGVQQTLGDIGNVGMGAAGIGGSLVAPGAATTVARASLRPVQSAIRNFEPIKFNVPTPRVGELVTKYRTQLSDIDPQYETILKQQPDATKTMAYFDQAEKAALDPSVPMATTLASRQAVNAFEAIDRGASEAGRLKSELLDSIAKQKISGNIAGNSIDNVKQTINQRYGIDIDNKGNIRQAEGRMASVDAKSQKLISDYVGMLRELGQSPTARQLDDFVDAAQRMLYKQSSPNLFDVADEPVIAFLKQQTGEINSQLKTNVDAALKASGKEPIYGELNAKYGELLEINNALNKRLGVEGDKGASLMKSLFSPQTGEPTRRLFQQIKDETGIDLFEEATLAKFAMESVGDVRSKSLLKSIDESVANVSKLNLMEPGSWLNFIRERADLDGRELAEAIIKQATSETSK